MISSVEASVGTQGELAVDGPLSAGRSVSFFLPSGRTSTQNRSGALPFEWTMMIQGRRFERAPANQASHPEACVPVDKDIAGVRAPIAAIHQVIANRSTAKVEIGQRLRRPRVRSMPSSSNTPSQHVAKCGATANRHEGPEPPLTRFALSTRTGSTHA